MKQTFHSIYSFFCVDTQRNAENIAKMVKVNYNNVCKPITTIEDAIDMKSFHPPRYDDFAIGNTERMYFDLPCAILNGTSYNM